MDPEIYFSKLCARGNQFLGTQVPFLGGAMTWVSNHQFVAALSNAGAFGTLASGAMSPESLSQEIYLTQQLTCAPFGVNIIVMHPQKEQLIDVCLELNVPFIIFAGGLPSRALIDQATRKGAKVLAFAPSAIIARKLVRMGVHALIIEGMEAGGHIGQLSTTILAQEILPTIREVPVFVAGGIGQGHAILGFMEMGAAGCQMGTRFVCAHESPAHPAFKQAMIQAQSRDAIVSPQLDARFPVIPVRALSNGGTEKFLSTQRVVIDQFQQGLLDQQQAQLTIEHFWAGALRRAVQEGDIETGSLMAGQSVGFVKEEEPIKEILETLKNQAIDALTQRHA